MTFRLNRHAREPYDQRITTDPQLTGWEASFDGGLTWHDGEDLTTDPEVGWVRWVLAGDRVDKGDAVAQLVPTGDEDLIPIGRLVVGSHIIARDLEPIRVE